jgi:protein-tyrosine-phosphatase
MSIADFRAYVSDAIQAAASAKGAPKPPKQGAAATSAGAAAVDAHGLDEREQAICKETGCDFATFAMLKARRATTV